MMGRWDHSLEGLEPPFHEAHKPRKSHPGTTSSKAPWDPWDPRRDNDHTIDTMTGMVSWSIKTRVGWSLMQSDAG